MFWERNGWMEQSELFESQANVYVSYRSSLICTSIYGFSSNSIMNVYWVCLMSDYMCACIWFVTSKPRKPGYS